MSERVKSFSPRRAPDRRDSTDDDTHRGYTRRLMTRFRLSRFKSSTSGLKRSSFETIARSVRTLSAIAPDSLRRTLQKAKSEEKYRLSNFSRARRRRVAVVKNDVRRIPVWAQGRAAELCRPDRRYRDGRMPAGKQEAEGDRAVLLPALQGKERRLDRPGAQPEAQSSGGDTRSSAGAQHRQPRSLSTRVILWRGRRLAHSLVMISRAAQKKINDVLWR